MQQSAFLKIIDQHIASHQTAGRPWPDDATHAVEYRLRCWPLGWDEWRIEFFTSEQSLLDWIRRYHRWAQLEDNRFEAVYYEWDLGPNVFRPRL